MTDQNLPGSILDRVISQKETHEIEHFNPVDVITGLLKHLSSREEDIIVRRHGLHGKPPETLEHIGNLYKVTRERVRQIESGAIAKVRKNHSTQTIVRPLADAIVAVLDHHGGVMREDLLFHHMLNVHKEQSAARAATLFTLRYLLADRVKAVPAHEDFFPAWQLHAAPIHLVREAIDAALLILEVKMQPLSSKDLIAAVQGSAFGQTHQYQLPVDTLVSYIDVSTKIRKNPYDEYGLASWGSVVPKRMSDKISLVLKRSGKPLHFNDVTRIINETKFDHRVAYAPTVHNELILNDAYVLVGRGIYALKDWGYKPGVVADILVDVLRREAKPMSRDALVAAVLKQRMVKRNTIHLALTNRTYFTKTPTGEYSLNAGA
ncbi:MAG: sigma factor-like helix-turn-helix DNA-binding protein [Patescibacteria group bacterium]